jgi:hypothetical protein
MSGLEAALMALLARLAEQDARFAIVGGLAVSVRTEPRFTRDADVCVAVQDDREAEEVVRSLGSSGYRVLAIVEQEATGRIATVRLAARPDRDDGVVLDLLFASSGVEREIVESSDDMEVFEGLSASIASVAGLIALKILARDDVDRPQDRVDLVALLRVASASDLAAADLLLGLITERGYDRGKDLAEEFGELRIELGR